LKTFEAAQDSSMLLPHARGEITDGAFGGSQQLIRHSNCADLSLKPLQADGWVALLEHDKQGM
jgi:hypothetical protein